MYRPLNFLLYTILTIINRPRISAFSDIKELYWPMLVQHLCLMAVDAVTTPQIKITYMNNQASLLAKDMATHFLLLMICFLGYAPHVMCLLAYFKYQTQ